MRLVINRPDGVVGIDGYFVSVDLSVLDLTVKAVQWHDTYGHIELYDLTNLHISSIVEFTDIFEAANLLINEEKTLKKIQLNKNVEQAEMRKKYFEQVTLLENSNAEFDYEYIHSLINASAFSGLTLGVRIRQSDGKAIGIDVLNAVKSLGENGSKTLLAIRKLFKFCRKIKVPFMTDVQPSTLDIDRYTDFLKSLGATIYRFNKETYYAQFLI